jgi:GT2 family glycosyltransferase
MRTDSKSWRELARIVRQVRSLCARSLAGNTFVRSARNLAGIRLARVKARVLLGFDREFYLNQYPDVAAAGADPLQHYLNHGRAERRAPSRIALVTLAPEKKPMNVGSDLLRLSDLCNPHYEEPGPKLSDETFVVTVLTPAFNTDPQYIGELYQTLVNQSYSNWEWVVVDDGSSRTASIAILREMARRDPRVRFFANPVNLGISGASNIGLSAARGTHVALVDHDDLVSRHAFLAVYEAWKQNPNTQLFYTDECKLRSDGGLSELWPKPGWSPAYLEYTMCVGHLSVYSRAFLNELGGFRSEFDGTQDFDLALRASLRDPKVVHIPIFAYIYRIIPGSAAAGLYEKSYAIERQGHAVLDYARQRHAGAIVAAGHTDGYWRIRYPLPPSPPLLSYVIPAGGGARVIGGNNVDLVLNCIRSFENKAFYPNREYIVVHNGGLTEAQIRGLKAIPRTHLVVHSDPIFNFSRTVNAGVAAAGGEYICLLNDDVEAITERGGEELVGYLAVNPRVGAIGPKCLFEDGRIQQCGLILLESLGPAHAAEGASRDFSGHQMHLICRHEAYGVGGAILVTRKSIYEEVGGFTEDLPLNYNDVDFCLRIRERGYRCVVDPAIEVYHFESATGVGNGIVEQERFFLTRADTRDPYFSKWFSSSSPYFELDLKAADRLRPFGPWLDRHIARRASQFQPKGRLKLSVCVSVYNQPKRFLEEMYRSVLMQTYAHKELVIIDNGSSNFETLDWLRRAQQDPHVTFVRVNNHIGINAANLKLLESASGDFFVPVDADDFLAVDALQMLAYEIERHPDGKVFYSDEYKSDMNSTRLQPLFKPDFDPILLMNYCYPAHLMAMEAEFLRRIGSFTDARTTWCHDYDTLTRALALGEAPIHVRELLYAWRINPGSTASAETSVKPGTVDSQRFVLNRLLNARGLESVVSVEPNRIETSAGMGRLKVPKPVPNGWRLKAAKPVPNAKIFDAREVWGNEGFGASGLMAAASEGGTEWIAILVGTADEQTVLELSAIALFEPRINAVCGVLIDDNRTVNWSGGFFLPHGRVFDPYNGQSFPDGGYHGELWCQRCVDVAAPVNVLIRVTALRRVAALSGVACADALMVMLGVDAHQRGELIAVTPHVQAPPPPKSVALPPLDRAGLLAGIPALGRGSRWYDERLEVERPYKMPEMA